jgi:hypothetical protein
MKLSHSMTSRHWKEVELYLYPHPTLALEGGKGSALSPGHFSPGRENYYPFYRGLIVSRRRPGWVQKVSTPLRLEYQTVQPVAIAIPITLSSSPAFTILPVLFDMWVAFDVPLVQRHSPYERLTESVFHCRFIVDMLDRVWQTLPGYCVPQ